MRFLQSWLLILLGVLLAALTSGGIHYADFPTLMLVALVLGFLNAVFKPLLVLFTLPFIILTLGLGVWIINALLLYLAGEVVPGFEVASFWSALWGALVISLTSMIVNTLTGKSRLKVRMEKTAGPAKGPRRLRRGGDVIDV